MLRRSRFLAPLAVTIVVLAACADGAPDPVDAAHTGTDEASGARSDLVLAIGGEPDDGYDPTLGWGRYGSPLFQSTLLRRDADLEVVGDLATDCSVSDDGRTWTLTIRDDVVFSDGEPLTAADVVYTYEPAATSGGLEDLADLASTVALDNTTVELTLTQPRSTFLAQLTSVGIVPAHAHGDGYGRDPLGSGPFVLERWAEGQELVVTRNDAYYGDPPAFERLVFLFTDEDGSRAAARSGDVQIAGLPQTLATDDVDGMDLVAVQSVDNRGIAFPIPTPGGTTEDGLPIGIAVTSDVAIRQALNLAVDRAALTEAVLEGYGTPA